MSTRRFWVSTRPDAGCSELFSRYRAHICPTLMQSLPRAQLSVGGSARKKQYSAFFQDEDLVPREASDFFRERTRSLGGGLDRPPGGRSLSRSTIDLSR